MNRTRLLQFVLVLVVALSVVLYIRHRREQQIAEMKNEIDAARLIELEKKEATGKLYGDEKEELKQRRERDVKNRIDAPLHP